jgi:cysteinyl-tRNA synthetase
MNSTDITLSTLHFYNSFERKLESFISKIPSQVRMYTCGPTIYDYAHIGNLRTFVFEDVLRRVLKLFGYQVIQVMNLTDIDDKTIKGATREGMSLRDFTDRFAQAFFEDIDLLNIERAEHYPRATDYVASMIKMIQTLIEKGFAYVSADNSVYFSITRFSGYGRLAHLEKRSRDAVQSRINNDEYDKETLGDFVLWKSYDSERDEKIFWDSPWGLGRPGWHIECSAMAMQILGEQLDIHTGGIDNLFPHHENEIAQSECCSGKPFARYWLHSEHLLVDGRKMSKSLGNFFTLRDLLNKGFDPIAIRYLLLQTHYRNSLNFTFEGINAASKAVQRLRDFHYRLQQLQPAMGGNPEAHTFTQIALLKFTSALADDLNMSLALAAVFDWIQEVHRLIDQNNFLASDVQQALNTLSLVDQILGVIEVEKVDEEPLEVKNLFNQRQQARLEKQWSLSDQLRDQILEKGYLVEDHPSGNRLKKIFKGSQ